MFHRGEVNVVGYMLDFQRIKLFQICKWREVVKGVLVGQQDQETLLQLADLENELREETSLTSFITGFQLGMGIAGEMERYCFEDEEEKRATERAKMRYPHITN